MGKKRKKSTAHRVPPLSWPDKAIYTVFSILFIIAFCGSVIGWILLPRWIAFRDPTVIAFKDTISHYVVVWPFFLFVFLLGVIAINDCFAGKKPIFGNKAIRYGEYPWKTDIFPLFGPQRRTVQRKPSEQRFRASVLRILTGIFIVTLLLGCLGIYGRTCLREDRTIIAYNSLNIPGEPVSIARDCDRITIKAEEISYRGGTPSWYYGVMIHGADGKQYDFLNKDFDLRHRGHTDCLKHLLAIKALFSSDQITFQGTELLPDVIEDNHLDEAQTALLEALFAPPR